MGVLIDCRAETIEEYGKCVEGDFPVSTVEPDILQIAGMGFNAYQLVVVHILFVTALTIFLITMRQRWLNKK